MFRESNPDDSTAEESRQQTPCRTFPFSVRVKRCFIRSVMPLQLTDGAIQEDTTVSGTLSPKWRRIWSIPTCNNLKAKKQFQPNPQDYSGGNCGTVSLLCWQGRATAQIVFFPRFIHSAVSICLHLSWLKNNPLFDQVVFRHLLLLKHANLGCNTVFFLMLSHYFLHDLLFRFFFLFFCTSFFKTRGT